MMQQKKWIRLSSVTWTCNYQRGRLYYDPSFFMPRIVISPLHSQCRLCYNISYVYNGLNLTKGKVMIRPKHFRNTRKEQQIRSIATDAMTYKGYDVIMIEDIECSTNNGLSCVHVITLRNALIGVRVYACSSRWCLRQWRETRTFIDSKRGGAKGGIKHCTRHAS